MCPTDPPDVSISLLSHTGPMVEGKKYQLQCEVRNVAPVQKITVSWYKGNETIKTDSYSDQSILTIIPSREDDGALYRCEAQLNLGPDGPPSVTSNPLNITVHCNYSTVYIINKNNTLILTFHSTVVIYAVTYSHLFP